MLSLTSSLRRLVYVACFISVFSSLTGCGGGGKSSGGDKDSSSDVASTGSSSPAESSTTVGNSSSSSNSAGTGTLTGGSSSNTAAVSVARRLTQGTGQWEWDDYIPPQQALGGYVRTHYLFRFLSNGSGGKQIITVQPNGTIVNASTIAYPFTWTISGNTITLTNMYGSKTRIQFSQNANGTFTVRAEDTANFDQSRIGHLLSPLNF